MRLHFFTDRREYAFVLDFRCNPLPIGYPQQSEFFAAKDEAIDAAREMGMIVLPDGSVIGQA